MLAADDIAKQLDGLVHLDTQRAPDGLDLTVDAVYRTTGHGQLDFGGGEFEAAPREPLTPVLDDPDDDYAWWTLEEGAYILRYNESLTLTNEQRARISPLERTLYADEALYQAGIHPRTTVPALSTTDLRDLYDAVQAVIGAAIAADADPRALAPDRFLLPHRFGDERCPATGVPLETEPVAGRTAYVSPARQTPPEGQT